MEVAGWPWEGQGQEVAERWCTVPLDTQIDSLEYCPSECNTVRVTALLGDLPPSL